MNFSNLALIALIASSSTASVTSFSNKNRGIRVPSQMTKKSSSALPMIYPGSSSNNIVAFTTTIHREEVYLETLSIPQLKQMQLELETLNERCTEEGIQTHPECDVELKDERDYAILQIQRVLKERTGENSDLAFVDMEIVREMVTKPWVYPLENIRQHIEAMETLNCECTEDGNQTEEVCDIQLKDERDYSIEMLTLYVESIEKLLSTEAMMTQDATAPEAQDVTKTKQTELSHTPEICQDASAEGEGVVEETAVPLAFDMGEIRNCVERPGTRSLVDMQAMLAELTANPAYGTQSERDSLKESLVSMIRETKQCMEQIKAFGKQGDKLDEVAVEKVMEAVIKTIPMLPNRGNPNIYQGPTDEYLVMI